MADHHGPLQPQPFLLVGERETPVPPWTMERLGEKLLEVEAIGRVTRREVGEIRAYVLTDVAPRLTEVEKRPSVAAKAVGATKWIGVATLAVTLFAQVAASFSPKWVGPIQNLLQILQGLGQ